MPLNLAGAGALAVDATFRGRVAIAFFWVARIVYTEDDQTTGHEQRVRFAGSIAAQGMDDFQRYAAMVATDPAIVQAGPYQNQTGVSDAQIVAAVTAMWDTLAGIPDA